MAIPAVKGVYHNGKIEPLENIPYKKDMEVLIVFLGDGGGRKMLPGMKQ